jgi:hypothetical protein
VSTDKKNVPQCVSSTAHPRSELGPHEWAPTEAECARAGKIKEDL